MDRSLPTLDLLGMPLARMDERGVLDHVFTALAQGRGGWLVTANLDHLHRYARDTSLRAMYADADLIVADGMPLVWASAVQGERLPERVAGSALIHRFAERAAREGRSMYFLGGEPGAAAEASRILCERHAGLRVLGTSAPRVHSPPTADDLDAVRGELSGHEPDLLLVGLGSPKQEELIHALRSDFPRAWMVGVGISFSFVAGRVVRAPVWMQRAGLEWVHRLAQEPGRLARRYLVDDLPFAAELFARSAAARLRK